MRCRLWYRCVSSPSPPASFSAAAQGQQQQEEEEEEEEEEDEGKEGELATPMGHTPDSPTPRSFHHGGRLVTIFCLFVFSLFYFKVQDRHARQ